MTRLEKASYCSQIVAAVAIVVSLIYVGRQISDNTTEVRNSAARDLIVFAQELDTWLVTNGDLADILIAGGNEYESLSPAHKLRFDNYVRTSLNLWERAFYYRQDGLLDDDGWAGWVAYHRGRMQMGMGWPDGKADDTWRRVYRAGEIGYGEAFRRHVNSVIAN